ncbi:hypothetical protein EV656_101183 [Rhodovulum adriaticum]|uniref:Uncharacterized protein n=1 Tax=Rhodovulum adriaticum TaxID=35804 RepID=A0A4R2NYH7_RHOAD|nr:hypothetical protein EV656_101183 [Rhodovulum adriaticum]
MQGGCNLCYNTLKKMENMDSKNHVHDVQITRESPNYRIM